MVPGSRAAEPVAAATTATADFCKTPSSRPGLVPGFTLLCGKRIPAGAFLGSFLSPTDDAVGDCVKRCAADSRCRAFSLDAREPPSGRVCTLYGSSDGYIDAATWVSGIRLVESSASRVSQVIGGGGGLFNDAPIGSRPIATASPSATPTPSTAARASPSADGDESPIQRGWRKAAKRPPAAADEAPPPPSPVRLPPPTASVRVAPPTATLAPSTSVTLTADMKALQPVFFATDRKPAPAGAALEASFTAGRALDVSYGVTVVSIPKNHTIGNVERPKFRWFRLSREAETDADHFRIKGITPLDRAAFVTELKDGPDSVLLFIHGYNVPFADAVFKAAQIAFDANFPGTVLAFSWPSAGEFIKYDRDRESAEFAIPDLVQIFRLLSNEIGKKNVYIVAHSMGNQVLVNALVQSALSRATLTINELVMAAPDVDKDVFARKVDEIRSVASNITVYASAADKALLASGEKSCGTRLGFVGPSGPNIFPGIEVIDVTAVGDDMLGLDHGTFSSSRAVLDDLGHLIRSVTHLKPDARTPELRLMPDQAHVAYWLYPE